MSNKAIMVFRNADLGNRLRKLPDLVLKKIREEVNALSPDVHHRFSRILSGMTGNLTPLEAQVIMRHTGCKIDDLYNPKYDLLLAYLRHTGELHKYIMAEATLQKVT